jgi:hypothetical protein
MYAQAVLADDENFDGLISDIEHVKTKVRQKQLLNENEKRLLEIAAFFEGANLYLHPENFIDLFGEWVNQGDLHKINFFTKSVKQNDDAISLAFNACGTFTQESFTAFIGHLEQQLRLHEAPNTPIIISSNNHSICIRFDQNNHEHPWLCLDSNGLQQISLTKTNNTYCAKTHQNFTNSVFNALTNNETLVVNITVLSKTPSSELNLNLERPNLSAYDSDGAGVLYIACQEGNTGIVNALLAKEGININKTTTDGCTPLYIAYQQKHPAIIELLLLSGLKLNIDNIQDKRTELHASLMALHTELHNEILKNRPSLKGQLNINLRTKAVIDSVNRMIQSINSDVGHEEKLNAINNCRSELYPLRVAKNIAKALLSVCIAATAAVFFLDIVPIGAAPAAAIALGTAALNSYGLFKRSPMDTSINRCLDAATTNLTEPPHPANQLIPAF